MIPRDVRGQVAARSNGFCEIKAACCTGLAVHVHHRKLRKQGGDNSLENLRAVCLECHQRVHANPAVSYERGWLVHSWEAA